MTSHHLAFTKMHALGNDFVVIDATRTPATLSQAQFRLLADRRRGIGCDQILLLEPPPRPGVDFGYRILNADGSEVGQCGNGVRCVARYAIDRGLTNKAELVFATRTTSMRVQVEPDSIRVNMGEPRFEPAQIPLIASARSDGYGVDIDGQRWRFGAVSMGNPHAVIQVESVDAAPVRTLGPGIETHALFPERVNVGFAEIVTPERIRLRVWERGAGETEACGSGACAAVAVLRQTGAVGDTVQVLLPGGELRIRWQGAGHPLWMEGPATTVFDGTWALT